MRLTAPFEALGPLEECLGGIFRASGGWEGLNRVFWASKFWDFRVFRD